MKNYFATIVLLITVLIISSCSSDDVSSENAGFAMTAKINDAIFEANNPFGNNEFSSSNIYNYYPLEDFIMLQGRQGGLLSSPEINIWLKKSDMVVGTYQIGEETFETPPSHFIDLLDNSNNINEYTKQGTIVITEVNTTTKIVKGTFEFTTVDELEDDAAPIGFVVSEGKFRYKYE